MAASVIPFGGLSRDELLEMASAVPSDPVVPGKPVTARMKLGEILLAYPRAAGVVTKYGLHCSGCHANMLDTLEVGARGHGLGEAEIAAMVWEINQIIRGEGGKAPLSTNKASGFCAILGNPDSINLTDEAAAQLKALKERRKRARYGVRIGIHKEPMNYVFYMDLERKPKRTDVVFKERGLKFFVDGSIVKLVKGLHISFESGFEGEGFRLQNPNLTRGGLGRPPVVPPAAAPAGPEPGGPPPPRVDRAEVEVPPEWAQMRYRNTGL